jgi:hypothetical protein
MVFHISDIEQVQHVKKPFTLPLRPLSNDSTRLRGGAPMASVLVARLDHLGLMASVIND